MKQFGLPTQELKSPISEHNSLMNVITEDCQILRDTIEVQRVPVFRYLPMNSRNGMKRLFRVSQWNSLICM